LYQQKTWAKIANSDVYQGAKTFISILSHFQQDAFSHFFIPIHAIIRGNRSYPYSINYEIMRKIVLAVSALILLLVINACKKSSGTSNARTVANLSGSYNLTALTASLSGLSVNLYDSLPVCERDNVIQLNSNLTAQFIDAGTVCVPPSDSSGTWSLSANTDTIYVAGSASYIKSWDGATLVLTNAETISGFPVVATTTLVKK
jgi:hypothetical protein